MQKSTFKPLHKISSSSISMQCGNVLCRTPSMHASKFIHKTWSTSAGSMLKALSSASNQRVEHLRDLTVVKQLAANSPSYTTRRVPQYTKSSAFACTPSSSKSSRIADDFVFTLIHAFRDNPYGQEVRGAPSSGWGFRPQSGMYLLNVYSVFKVHEGIRFVPQ